VAIPPGYSTRTAGLGLQAMLYVCKFDRGCRQPGSSAPFQYCGLEMWISAVPTDALSAYIEEMDCEADSSEATRISALLWVPASVLNIACPDAIGTYKAEHPQEFLGSNSGTASTPGGTVCLHLFFSKLAHCLTGEASKQSKHRMSSI
jgi:hypothetical protein